MPVVGRGDDDRINGGILQHLPVILVNSHIHIIGFAFFRIEIFDPGFPVPGPPEVHIGHGHAHHSFMLKGFRQIMALRDSAKTDLGHIDPVARHILSQDMGGNDGGCDDACPCQERTVLQEISSFHVSDFQSTEKACQYSSASSLLIAPSKTTRRYLSM